METLVIGPGTVSPDNTPIFDDPEQRLVEFNRRRLSMVIYGDTGAGRKVADYNLPRECIRTYFPQRKCFVFPRPVEDQAMLRTLESVADSRLNPEFLQQTKAFLQYVFESGRIKTVSGRSINGRC